MRDFRELDIAEDERTAIAPGGNRSRELVLAAGFAVLLVVLYLAHLYSYNLFHSFAELFSIGVALAVAAIAWHTRHIARNDFLLFLGVALAFVAVTDTLHLLAFKGMGVFRESGADLPTQLWLAGRYEFTLAFLVLPLLLGRGAGRLRWAVAGFGLVWTGLLLSIFAWPIFPVALIDGQGLTPFKKFSEYAISALLLVALGLLWRRRAVFERRILLLLSSAIVLTIVSELAFTLYVDPDGWLNLLGHYLKILAFFLLYLAIVDRALVLPYSLLFHGLRERELELEQSQRELAGAVTRLEGIGQVSETVMQSLELHELMDSALVRIAGLVDAPAALIMLRRGGSLVAVATHGLPRDMVDDFSLSLGEGVAGRAAETREPVVVEDVYRDMATVHPNLAPLGIRSMLAVPLLRAGEVLGVLSVYWERVGAPATADIRFIEMLADRVSAGVYNADLYRQQKDVAEVLQREMLVLPAQFPGLRFGHAYRSASEGAHVGGDFYDVFSDEDGRAWLVMGDVSGHGVEAATAATFIREITRAFAIEIGEPGQVMQKVNKAVVQRLDFRHYATLFLGALDLKTRKLRYCSAGHPPGVVIGGVGALTELTSHSLPVGAFAIAAYQTETVSVAPGHAVFLYTDGITEARHGREFFGEPRLFDVLRRGYPPEQVPQEVLRAVDAFSDGRLIDDLAALCVSPAPSR